MNSEPVHTNTQEVIGQLETLRRGLSLAAFLGCSAALVFLFVPLWYRDHGLAMDRQARLLYYLSSLVLYGAGWWSFARYRRARAAQLRNMIQLKEPGDLRMIHWLLRAFRFLPRSEGRLAVPLLTQLFDRMTMTDRGLLTEADRRSLLRMSNGSGTRAGREWDKDGLLIAAIGAFRRTDDLSALWLVRHISRTTKSAQVRTEAEACVQHLLAMR